MSASGHGATRTVCLIHELADRRVWWRLLERLPSDVRTVVIEPEATSGMSPMKLASQLRSAALEAVASPAELVIAADVGTLAATTLVNKGDACHALLFTPETQSLLEDPAFEQPPLPPQMAEFLLAMAPYQAQLHEHGTLPEEGIRVMVQQSLGRCDELTEEDKRMLEEISVLQWQRRMPLDVSSFTSGPLPRMPDWLGQVKAAPTAFTVYVGDLAGLGAQLRKVLALRAPEAEVIAAPTQTAFPWLEEPDAVATLVTDLLEKS